MISKKEFKEKYIKPSLESQKWDEKYRILSNSNDIIAFVEHLQTATEFYFNDSYICAVIKNFTYSNTTNERKTSLINKLIEKGFISFAENNGNLITFTKPNGKTITFVPLTEVFPNIKIKDELESDERSGRCHHGSLTLSQFEFDFDHKIVTGYTYNISNKSKYLHSWIEANLNGIDVVVDYTMNAIIDKNAYYDFMHAEPITEIAGKDVKQDIPLVLRSKYKGYDNRMYLLFRDEMMREIQNQPSANSK